MPSPQTLQIINIGHLAYQLWCPSTINTISHQTYQPLGLSAISYIMICLSPNHNYWSSCLSSINCLSVCHSISLLIIKTINSSSDLRGRGVGVVQTKVVNFFHSQRDSTIANVHLYVCQLPNPLSLSESSLSASDLSDLKSTRSPISQISLISNLLDLQSLRSLICWISNLLDLY